MGPYRRQKFAFEQASLGVLRLLIVAGLRQQIGQFLMLHHIVTGLRPQSDQLLLQLYAVELLRRRNECPRQPILVLLDGSGSVLIFLDFPRNPLNAGSAHDAARCAIAP
jgi:hypothetical protein